MKFLLRLALGFLAVLVVLLVTLPLYIDSVAAAAVERGGSRALGVATHVGSTDVALFSGGFSLSDLQVDNPEGFPSESFLSLDSGSAEVALGTLLEDPVRIPSLHLRGARLNLERKGLEANYAIILDHLESGTDEPTDESTGYVIDELLLQNLAVRVDLIGVGGEATATEVTIDEIRLREIGSDNAGGVVMDQLARILMQAILEAVAEHGVEALPDAVIQEISAGLSQLTSLGDQGIEVSAQLGAAVGGALKKAGEELGGAAQKAAKDALDELGGALGGDDTEKKDDKQKDDKQKDDEQKDEDGGERDSD